MCFGDRIIKKEIVASSFTGFGDMQFLLVESCYKIVYRNNVHTLVNVIQGIQNVAFCEQNFNVQLTFICDACEWVERKPFSEPFINNVSTKYSTLN